ncbi:MAG: hypothetical protein AUK36_07645 [Zetaproteobacteria bacterium CG2_30_59_37]|nr:MAG: hypothetical protein AUK36_07645 [Zetaproteobacteria bacterium CG2_30_59_37]
MDFTLHTIETAPEAIRPELEGAQKKFGAIPNLYRGLAESPAALKIYLHMSETLYKFGRLTPVEQQVVYLSISAENDCGYCVGAHSTLATMVNMPEEVLVELREKTTLSDLKLDALRRFALSALQNRGGVPEEDLATFAAAGYEQTHAIEVLTILGQKIISNYFNHLTDTPLDPMFAPFAWQAGK